MSFSIYSYLSREKKKNFLETNMESRNLFANLFEYVLLFPYFNAFRRVQ